MSDDIEVMLTRAIAYKRQKRENTTILCEAKSEILSLKQAWLVQVNETESRGDAIVLLKLEIDRLRKIEAALPKTADGVPVVDGMQVYARSLKNKGRVEAAEVTTQAWSYTCLDEDTNSWEPDTAYSLKLCYSSMALALARDGEKGGDDATD